MPFVLVTLLLFALLVTLAGFLLSARPQSTMQHVVPSRPPIARRIGGTVHQPPPRYARAPVQRATRAMLNPSIGIHRGRRQAGEPVRWSVIVIGLVSVFVLGLFTLGKVFPHSAVLNPVWFADGSQPTPAANQKEPLSGTSQRLVRLSQLDPAQYNSPQEYNTWAYSACSAAAMSASRLIAMLEGIFSPSSGGIVRRSCWPTPPAGTAIPSRARNSWHGGRASQRL